MNLDSGAIPFGIGSAVVAVLLAFEPIPEVGFVLQMVAVGGAIGLAIAFALRLHDPDADVWLITNGAALTGLVVGVVLTLIDALVS